MIIVHLFSLGGGGFIHAATMGDGINNPTPSIFWDITMPDYVFNYTNTPSASFVVKPYTVNGPMTPTVTTPYVNVVSGVHAIAINTPLALVGKGITDYGQVVQNNLLYLAENFCSPTPPIPPMIGMLWYKSDNSLPSGPTYPAAKGLYVWDGTEWLAIAINGEMQVDMNANGYRIVNVADAIADTDALTTNSANLRYLKLSGGTLSGNLVLSPTHTVKVDTAPTAGVDVTNKLYVDAADLILQNDIDNVADNLATEVLAINGQIANLYPKTGGQISGNVIITGNLTLSSTSNLTITSGSGIVDFSNHVIQNVGNPILAHDAAHKAYVDTTIAAEIANLGSQPTGQADGVVSAASLNEATGVLTLTRTQGLPAITATGLFAERSHLHASDTIAYDPAYNQQQSGMFSVMPPVTNVRDAIKNLDQRLTDSASGPVRTVVAQTVSGNTTFVLDNIFEYIVWSNTLNVYMDGIKQYCDIRPSSSVTIDAVGLYSIVNLAPGVYTQNIVVDSTTYTITVTVSATTTYVDLLRQIEDDITLNAIPVVCSIDQDATALAFIFVTNLAGGSHTVALTTGGAYLFEVIPGAAPQYSVVEQILAYEEVGTPMDGSLTIKFHTAPPVGALLEIIVDRSLT